MSDEQPGGGRDLILYVQVSIAMVFLVLLFWALCAGVANMLLLLWDPALQERFQAAATNHRDTARFVPEMMKLLAPRVPWGLVALVTSLLTFPILGWILGRYAHDPSWAGVLPLVDVASGFSPLLIVFPETPQLIPLPEQIGILVVQIVTVQGTAMWAHEKRERVA